MDETRTFWFSFAGSCVCRRINRRCRCRHHRRLHFDRLFRLPCIVFFRFFLRRPIRAKVRKHWKKNMLHMFHLILFRAHTCSAGSTHSHHRNQVFCVGENDHLSSRLLHFSFRLWKKDEISEQKMNDKRSSSSNTKQHFVCCAFLFRVFQGHGFHSKRRLLFFIQRLSLSFVLFPCRFGCVSRERSISYEIRVFPFCFRMPLDDAKCFFFSRCKIENDLLDFSETFSHAQQTSAVALRFISIRNRSVFEPFALVFLIVDMHLTHVALEFVCSLAKSVVRFSQR